MIRVKVVTTPTGEAREWVRKAWVGLVLPSLSDRPETYPSFGVLSARRPFAFLLHKLGLRPTTLLTGYRVPSSTAVGLLFDQAPEAAEWWRDNLPWTCTPTGLFLFNAAAVEPLDPVRGMPLSSGIGG